MNSIDKISIPTAAPARPLSEKPQSPVQQGGKSQPFSELLDRRLETEMPSSSAKELKFSAHAQTRMQSRGIELSPQELLKIRDAVSKAGEKGSRESLILTDKAAFVVSVKNGTVITAMDRDSLKENVFTNIDSTVMI